MAVAEITPTEFVARRERGESLTLLDVARTGSWASPACRTSFTFRWARSPIASASSIAAREVVVLCRSGRRSLEVANFLQQNGFQAVNLAGGILAWSRELDATIPTY